jgi:flagellar motility protein MotE (MotC chaperone)
MKISNKHRKTNWEQVAKEFQSERDALQQEVLRTQTEFHVALDRIKQLEKELADEKATIVNVYFADTKGTRPPRNEHEK